MGRFDLVDGKCPVCCTMVDHVVDGIRVHFTPHDDPDVCRSLAQIHVRTLTRVIDQVNEERATAQYKEHHFRHAYGVAVNMLYDQCEHVEKPGVFEARIEAEIRKDNEDAKLRHELIAMQMKRGAFAP